MLNIFPRRRESATTTTTPEPPAALPEPSPEALEETPARRVTRRGTRGGRGRTRTSTAVRPSAEAAAPVPETPARRAPRRTPTASRVGTSSRAAKPAAEEPAPAPARAPRVSRARAQAPAVDGSLEGLATALQEQSRQLDELVRLNEELARKVGSAGAGRPPRGGVFVDVANVELATDRVRSRLDWAKILAILTHDRELVRAVAYAPVHEDTSVSIETQRFVEPFLDKGYKVITKPVKRFSDGSIKGNVDIELALDVMNMIDRLDVVCLVSGDGDFQRLVEVVQARGVRVEVIAFGSSTATNLRNAADHYIDLQARLREVRV